MRIQMLNQSDAEKVFGTYYNATAGTLAAETVVALLANSNGNSISTPVTDQLDLVVGIVDSAILTLRYGDVQIYGYRATSAVAMVASTAGVAGDKLVPVAGATYLTKVAAGDGRDGLFAMAGTFASSTGSQIKSCKILIRAM